MGVAQRPFRRDGQEHWRLQRFGQPLQVGFRSMPIDPESTDQNRTSGLADGSRQALYGRVPGVRSTVPAFVCMASGSPVA